MATSKTGFTLRVGETIPRIAKAPAANEDYYLDWADATFGPWLAQGDTLASASWAIAEGDGQLALGTQGLSSTVTYAWLSGGTAGTSYRVSCTITTIQGRVETRSFWVDVQTR